MSSKEPLVSIIVRTKNEERWISSCLRSIYQQSYKNVEVVLVDNESTDMTVKKAKEFPVKLISIKGFLPGKSINDGIKASGHWEDRSRRRCPSHWTPVDWRPG